MLSSLLSRLRDFKFTYVFFNIFQYDKLKHNIPHFRRLGLKKSYFSPISSQDFNQLSEPLAIKIKVPEDLAEKKNQFDKEGFLVLPSFFSTEQVDRINEEVDHLVESGKKKFAHRHKLMFAIDHSEYLMSIGKNPEIQRILNALLGDEAILFQSINFDFGSEQATHSDSIHMTTYPLGGLIAIWIALEDVGPDQGPLHYYPGSHKLPYYLNKDYDNTGDFWQIGNKGYQAYEEMISRRIKESGLSKTDFYAKKGDVLIWHANLFHGGNSQRNRNITRKSMVLHYFAKNCICYHEITQRPALIEEKRYR
jgi:ectoine hydroxylase-related dioxygenase (phytanoyl-CoA dioxygenase family)